MLNLLKSTVIGDVLGSYYEGVQPVELLTDPKTLLEEERLYRILPLKALKQRKTWTFTDDTICSLALADAHLLGKDKAANLREYCGRYAHPLIGFGGTFKKWLSDPLMPAYASNANGCLMRIGFIPLLDISVQEAKTIALECTNLTHNHTQAQQVTSDFIELCYALKNTQSKSSLSSYLKRESFSFSVANLRQKQIFEMQALFTLNAAVVCVVEAESFTEVLLNCLNIGGDSDTLAVVALSMAQHLYPVDENLLDFCMRIIKSQSIPLYNELLRQTTYM